MLLLKNLLHSRNLSTDSHGSYKSTVPETNINFGRYEVIWFNKVQGRHPPVRLKVSWLSPTKSSRSITSAKFAKGIQIGACEGHDFAIHSSNICLFERKLLSWTRSCVLVDSYWYYTMQSWLECQATTLCRWNHSLEQVTGCRLVLCVLHTVQKHLFRKCYLEQPTCLIKFLCQRKTVKQWYCKHILKQKTKKQWIGPPIKSNPLDATHSMNHYIS